MTLGNLLEQYEKGEIRCRIRPARRASSRAVRLKTPKFFVIRTDDWEPIPVMAAFAIRIANRLMDQYYCESSPKKFTQSQLLACLILKRQCNNSYRDLARQLQRSPRLQGILCLPGVPHFTTFKHFADRSLSPQLLRELQRKCFYLTLRYRDWISRKNGH